MALLTVFLLRIPGDDVQAAKNFSRSLSILQPEIFECAGIQLPNDQIGLVCPMRGLNMDEMTEHFMFAGAQTFGIENVSVHVVQEELHSPKYWYAQMSGDRVY